MDEQQQYGMPEYHHIPQPQRPASNGLAVASLVLGILSLVFFISGMSLPLGGLSILFALLSRKDGSMTGQAKAGLSLSIAGIVIETVVLIYAIFFTPFLDTVGDMIEEQLNSIYGNEFYDDDFNDDFDEDFYDEYINKDNTIYQINDFENVMSNPDITLSSDYLNI